MCAEHSFYPRSVTIVVAKIATLGNMSAEGAVASILDALPYLQHVKLVPESSYYSQNFQPIAEALARLTRLESLDIVDFHASILNASMDTWARIGVNLVAFRVTVNQAERVENRRNPVFRTIVANAHHLRALELAGAQATRDVVQMLAALPHPEALNDLRLSLATGQTISSLATTLNRLERLQDLSIAIGGGFESVYFPPEKNTFGRAAITEVSIQFSFLKSMLTPYVTFVCQAFGHLGIQLAALRHLHLTCCDAALVSLGLGCASPCTCERCLPAAVLSMVTPHIRWLSPNESKPTSVTTPFFWGPPSPARPVDIHV